MSAETRDISEFSVDHLEGSSVRVTHVPTGLSRTCARYPVQSMNHDHAYDELVMELETNPDL